MLLLNILLEVGDLLENLFVLLLDPIVLIHHLIVLVGQRIILAIQEV